MTCSLIEHFDELPDPRVRGRRDYPLIEIVFLCISAIISGFDGWEAVEDFGHGKLEWLRKCLPYENGIPRHDTVARVMSCLSPKALQSCCVSWVQSIAKITEGEIGNVPKVFFSILNLNLSTDFSDYFDLPPLPR